MSEFRWHKTEDEVPEFGNGDYMVMGLKGALYYASRYAPYSSNSLRTYFYIPNNRHSFLDVEKVKAWAEIPPFEEVGE